MNMTNRAEVQAKLMELWVPCPVRYDGWDDPRGTHPPTCQCAEPDKAYGSGHQYLLRRECQNKIYSLHFPNCLVCSNLGYVFNDAPDAIWNAVLTEGGTLRAWIDRKSYPNVDPSKVFVAECRLGSSLNQPQLAAADSMAEALELAVLKALEATDGS